MTLGVVCALGFLFAWALGADLRRLADVRLRASWLVFIALALQLVAFVKFPGLGTHEAFAVPLHLASYGLLVLFAATNARVRGFGLATLGLLANAIVIVANGGRMPVPLHAWESTGLRAGEILRSGHYNNNVLATAGTHLGFLGDIFPLPGGLPLTNTFSVGDLLLLAGATLFVYCTCTDGRDRNLHAALQPLALVGFRQLLLGRSVSKCGDWLTLAATITWIFGRTHSTVYVSALLLARVGGAIAGALVSASILDRYPRTHVLAVVELARAGCVAAMIAVSATGHVTLLFPFVFASAFVAAATDPTASSLVPDLLPRSLVHRANALHAVSRSLVMCLGALAGSLATSWLGIQTALGLDVATFCVALVLYVRLRPPTVARPVPGPSEPAALRRRDVARTILRSRLLVCLVGSFVLVTLAMGVLNAGLAQFLATIPRSGGYGVGIAAIAGGLVCGEFLTGFLREASVVRRAPAIAFALSAGFIALISGTNAPTTALLLLFLLGASDGITETAYDTLVQDEVAADVRAGVFALAGAVQQGGMVVGLALAPVLASSSPSAPLRLAAAAAVCGACVAVGMIVRAPRLPAFLAPAYRRPANTPEG